MVEHFTDGDLFDDTVEPGWTPMSASGQAQWGPPVTRDFLGTKPSPKQLRAVLAALRWDNAFVSAIGGLGISYFQQLLPSALGRATTMSPTPAV
jgi:hypothetical protein